MSDRNDILGVLLDGDGRVWQREFRRQLDEGHRQISELLGEMEREGEIERVKLGRENLVCLPARVPEAARPPEVPDA